MAKTDTPPEETTHDAGTLDESTGWRPSPGDTLAGPIVAITKAWSDWTNSFYPLVTIHDETQDKDIDVHCFHHTLQSRLMETRPKVGDKLEIAYLGKQRTKDGKRTVAVYRLNVPGADGQAVWDSLDAQTPAAARAAKQGSIPDTQEEIPF